MLIQLPLPTQLDQLPLHPSNNIVPIIFGVRLRTRRGFARIDTQPGDVSGPSYVIDQFPELVNGCVVVGASYEEGYRRVFPVTAAEGAAGVWGDLVLQEEGKFGFDMGYWGEVDY